MSVTPPAAMASASPVFCTHTPTAPACTCSLASIELLCILACGRHRSPCLRQKSAMRVRLRSMASRSTTRAGVSIAVAGWPTRRSGEASGGVVVGRGIVEVLGVGPADEGEALLGPEQAVDGAVGKLPG